MLTRGTAVCGLQREAAVLFNDEGEVRGPVAVHARLVLAHTQRFHGPTDKARQRTAHGVFAGRLGFVASVLQWPGCQVCVAVCVCGCACLCVAIAWLILSGTTARTAQPSVDLLLDRA